MERQHIKPTQFRLKYLLTLQYDCDKVSFRNLKGVART
nr:MAG TPA: hypothetical protein [Caudoviricetes sp.]